MATIIFLLRKARSHSTQDNAGVEQEERDALMAVGLLMCIRIRGYSCSDLLARVFPNSPGCVFLTYAHILLSAGHKRGHQTDITFNIYCIAWRRVSSRYLLI